MEQSLRTFDANDRLEEVITESSSGGRKGVKDERYDLIPVMPLRQLALVYGMGAKKYTPNNWRKGYEWSKNIAAMQRHIEAFRDGEEGDQESGLPHLAHVAWHCFTLMWFAENKREFDDRPDVVRNDVPNAG